ncbi:DUF4173 domain-containing protein [Streptomyces sp. ME03-5709C]|nr:DUF4173 domain-containing protein [Streptomyces sp. ME03-5709C]
MSDTPSDAAPAGQAPAQADPKARSQGPPRRPGPPVHPAPAHPRPWTPPPPPPPPAWVTASRARTPRAVRPAVLWTALLTGVLTAALLRGGLGINLLLVAVPAAAAAAVAALDHGRRPRPWSGFWAVAGLTLLLIPALRDAWWPSFLAVAAAAFLGSMALHGGRRWPGVLLGGVGLWCAPVPAIGWALRGLRRRAGHDRSRLLPILKTVGVTGVLLGVFGALFAGADAAFADLLADLMPDVTVTDAPLRILLLAVGTLFALCAAWTAAAPRRWDRVKVKPGRARGRTEWALPLVVLAALFAAFNAVQLAVLFGGYQKVLAKTGLTYAQYARQGFWQLLVVTLLTVVVIGLALRWAPRDTDRDRLLVRSVLGAICVLTLVVVASALRRMDLYVGAYGLTRLRISVAGVELWLGLLIVLVMAAGVFGARWLPRAVVVSAAASVLAFGLVSPDALIAGQQVSRFASTGKIDLAYLRDLSADAVPELDRLPEPQRSCALEKIAEHLSEDGDEAWYTTSLGEVRARSLLHPERAPAGYRPCDAAGLGGFDDEWPDPVYP